MSKAANFAEFTLLLGSNSANFTDDQVRITLNSGFDSGHIQSILVGIGYIFDQARTLRGDIMTISMSAANWTGECPIFADWGALFSKVIASSIVPSHFYIVESKSSSLEEHSNSRKLELICKTRQLLAQLSDHCDPQSGAAKGSRKLVYVIETENSFSKHEFKPNVSWEVLSHIENTDSALISIEKLLKVINVGDSQDTERKNVLRSAFSELISRCLDQSDIFPTILRSANELHNKYEAHHELFVKRFSVNKVLQEINDQDLKYTSKINEIVSSAQNKALTIPGALIAIGAIMKIDHIADGIAVAVGMMVTTIIVHRSLEVHHATIDHLDKQVEADFRRYDTLNEKAEVRMQANITRSELKGLLKTATINSTFIKKCIWWLFFASIAFIVFSSFPIESQLFIGEAFSLIATKLSSIVECLLLNWHAIV
jgi:hypothetical protein